MKATNARKALAKVGTLRTGPNGSGSVLIGEHEVSFLVNGQDHPEAEIVCVRERRISDRDDPMSDYSAGSFYNSLGAAVRYAQREAQRDAVNLDRHYATHSDASRDVRFGCMYCTRIAQGRHLTLVES